MNSGLTPEGNNWNWTDELAKLLRALTQLVEMAIKLAEQQSEEKRAEGKK
jgi:hypothetical protein